MLPSVGIKAVEQQHLVISITFPYHLQQLCERASMSTTVLYYFLFILKSVPKSSSFDTTAYSKVAVVMQSANQ